jgi:MerR family transcriptional regulator/heat shock protein HspR
MAIKIENYPYKIGEAAKQLGISVHTIRMYEREGILICYKNKAGTRFFNDTDIRWIEKIQSLIADGMNIDGIRRMLSLVPCWNLYPCDPHADGTCPVFLDNTMPCWAKKDNHCRVDLLTCKECLVYKKRFETIELKHKAFIQFKDPN